MASEEESVSAYLKRHYPKTCKAVEWSGMMLLSFVTAFVCASMIYGFIFYY